VGRHKARRKSHRYAQPQTSVTAVTDSAGWISTPIAHLNVRAADHLVDRCAATIPTFEGLRAALKQTKGSHDLTCRRRARGILTYGDLSFIV